MGRHSRPGPDDPPPDQAEQDDQAPATGGQPAMPEPPAPGGHPASGTGPYPPPPIEAPPTEPPPVEASPQAGPPPVEPPPYEGGPTAYPSQPTDGPYPPPVEPPPVEASPQWVPPPTDPYSPPPWPGTPPHEGAAPPWAAPPPQEGETTWSGTAPHEAEQPWAAPAPEDTETPWTGTSPEQAEQPWDDVQPTRGDEFYSQYFRGQIPPDSGAVSGAEEPRDWPPPPEEPEPGEWQQPFSGWQSAEPQYHEADTPTDPTPPPPPDDPERRSRFSDGQWHGGHRRDGRRGVSIGVVVALVAVLVAVAGVIGWRFFGDVLSNRSTVAAGVCLDGEEGVAVIADPTIADQITELAGRYNESARPIGDQCMRVAVTAADGSAVVDGLGTEWPADLGGRPALWIPGSSISTAQLESVAGAEAISDARSLVRSPVLLAVKPQMVDAMGDENWGSLPALQTRSTALDDLGLPGWGALRLALPTAGNGDAAYLAAEAVATATAPDGSPPTAGLDAVNTLLGGQPPAGDAALSTAMDALLDQDDPAAAPVHAVVTTEQQLFHRASDLDDASDVVASWLPPGSPALADYPTALLAGDWLSQEQVTAASEFARFLRKPEQLEVLASAGFRADGRQPPSSDVMSFDTLADPLPLGDAAERVAIADAITTPADRAATNIVLDLSMTTSEGPNTRMGNVVDTLIPRIDALPVGSIVGLWTFDGVEGRTEVTAGPLSDSVDGQPRAQALTATLDEQSSVDGGTVSFTTLRMVYDDALATYQDGFDNSVLVITAGPHTDRTLDGAGLQEYVRDAFDPSRPIAINVIDFGADADQSTWEAVAELSGGSYRNLATSDSPELAAAIVAFVR